MQMKVTSGSRSLLSAGATSRAPVAVGRLAAPLRRTSVIRRFKEGDEFDTETQRRRELEGVIQKQEESLKKVVDQGQRKATSAGNEIRQDVKAVVDATTASAGKGYAAAVKVPFWVPAFTRRREAFIGRVAMMGFAATCALEIMQPGHPGPIGQVMRWSGLSEPMVMSIITGIVVFNIVGGLGPWSPTFSPENYRDVSKRPEGPPSTFVNPLDIGRSLGISGWGFTKRNELFQGRLAMLGFLAAAFNEVKTGSGVLGQMAGYRGIYPDDAYFSICTTAFLGFTALMLALSVFAPSRLQGSAAKEDDIY